MSTALVIGEGTENELSLRISTMMRREGEVLSFEEERRRAAAHMKFKSLPEELRRALVEAASRNRMVYERLNAGRWEGVSRALLGVHYLKDPTLGYLELAEEVRAVTTNALNSR